MLNLISAQSLLEGKITLILQGLGTRLIYLMPGQPKSKNHTLMLVLECSTSYLMKPTKSPLSFKSQLLNWLLDNLCHNLDDFF
jgi:hypothetical protein